MFEYFILGIIIYNFIFPIFEQFSSLILTWIEYFKAKVSVKIASLNSEINKIAEGEIPTASFPIGFHMPSEEEEFYDEDDE